MARPEAGKRIVLATYGSPGDLQPFLAIGAELRARGHDPIVATSEVYHHRVADENLRFAPVRPDRTSGQQDPDFLRRLIRDRKGPATVFRAMFLPSLREALADLQRVTRDADLVVAHPLASAARLASEARGVPWLSAVMQPMGYLSAYEPPVVGPHWLSAAFRTLGPRASGSALKLARRLTDRWTKEWHDLRADLGLAPVKDNPLWEGQHSPLCSLGLFSRVLGDPQPDWPPQARVTGFPFYRARESLLDPRLRAFLENGEPPVVFTLGTTAVNDPGTFYAESADASRHLGLRAVLVGHGDQEQSAGRSHDVIAVPYAPHDLVFPFACVIVHQGGIGTLSEGLLAGKPMLIMPYAHDQADNAWRADRLGVARVVARGHYRSGRVSHELGRLVDDRTYLDAAMNVARMVSWEHGAKAAADLIDAAVR
jgi:rhamnosyltransferase subunit B